MALTLEQSRKLKNTGVLIAVGILAGLIYPIFSDGFHSVYPYINGMIGGTLIALSFALFEFVLYTGKLKRLPFYKILLLRGFFYSISIFGFLLLVFIIYRMLRFNLSFTGVLQSSEFLDYIWKKDFIIVVGYTFALVFLTDFTWQMSRKMGQGVLREFITGAYYHPREEERIIMYVSIQEPKKIIEKIGRLNYHKYLNDIFYNITSTILLRKGEIYEYVDNELLLIWKKEKGLANANCVRVFFDIKNKLAAGKIAYHQKYGIIPRIVASLHFGKVIKGEIGTVKSEISYYGDPMNTGSRILGLCGADKELLVSGPLLEQITLPPMVEKRYLGSVLLKGKLKEIDLFAIHEKELKINY